MAGNVEYKRESPASIYSRILSRISAAFAALASPTFTGTPSAPTAALYTNTTQLATTAFAIASIGELVFNVKMYGAFGDGVTDDTTAIRAALTAAAVSGGIVYFPRGIYLISNTLSLASKVRVMGCGRGNTVVRGTAANFGTFEMNGVDRASVEHLTIDQQTNGQTGNGVAFGLNGSTYATNCSAYQVEVLLYTGHQYGIVNFGGRRIKVTHCWVDGGQSRYVTGSSQEGIETLGGDDVLYAFNTVRNCGANGMYCGSVTLNNLQRKNIRIVNNFIENCRNGINVECDASGSPHYLDGVTISGNQLRNIWDNPIKVTTVGGVNIQNLTIATNQITSCGGVYYTVTITGSPTGGTEKLIATTRVDGVNASATTATIAFNASAATVQAALEALSTVGTGGAVVTGSNGGPYTITLSVPTTLTLTANALTGGTAPSVTIAPAGGNGSGIFVNGDSTVKASTTTIFNLVVEGNTIDNCIGNVNGHGIFVQNMNNVRLSKNNIRDCGIHGILFFAVNDCSAKGNHIDTVVRNGIRIESTSSRVVLADNEIWNWNTSAIGYDAIDVYTTTYGSVTGTRVHQGTIGNDTIGVVAQADCSNILVADTAQLYSSSNAAQSNLGSNPVGVDAATIGAGTVSNTFFGYLSTLTTLGRAMIAATTEKAARNAIAAKGRMGTRGTYATIMQDNGTLTDKMGQVVVPFGTAGSLSGNPPTTTDPHFGRAYATSAVSGNTSGHDSGNPVYRTGGRNMWCDAKICLKDTTSRRAFWGLSDQVGSTMLASDNPAGNYACFYASTSSSTSATNWLAVVKDGTTQNVFNTGVACDTGYHTFDIRMTDASSPTQIDFYIDGTLVKSHTTNLPPAGVNMYATLGIINLTTAVKTLVFVRGEVSMD